MAIKYKKIIEEIMGEEAKKRGYKITSHPQLLATKPLAILERTINGYSQSIQITEDLIHKGDVYIVFEGKKYTYHYDDEASYRKIIGEINEYMLDEGYVKMDKHLQKPCFFLDDVSAVLDNYLSEYEIYRRNHPFVCIKDDISYIKKLFEDTYSKEWLEAKSDLIYISELLVGLMLDKIDGTHLEEGINDSCFYIERFDGLKTRAEIDPLQLVMVTYKNKDTEKWLIEFVKEFFSDEELNKTGL